MKLGKGWKSGLLSIIRSDVKYKIVSGYLRPYDLPDMCSNNWYLVKYLTDCRSMIEFRFRYFTLAGYPENWISVIRPYPQSGLQE